MKKHELKREVMKKRIIRRRILTLIFFFMFVLPTTGFIGKTSNGNPRSDSDMKSLIYSSYFGGSSTEHGLCIARDSQNDIVLAGITYSSDFPTTLGAFDSTYNGQSDIFVSKISADGTTLVFSTFLGGSKHETFVGTGNLYHTMEIAIDSEDNIVIYGTTQSIDFPTTEGAYNTTFNGDQDVFVTKLSTDGSTLLFSTFLGGTSRDSTVWVGHNRLILDDEDNIFVTGYTNSTDFPITPNAYDKTLSSDSFDIFISQLSANGSVLEYSTFFGGEARDYPTSLALDSEGRLIVGGCKTSGDFPTTEGAWDREVKESPWDGFITKFSANGSTLEFSTFLGGTGGEVLTAIVMDEDDNIYCTGHTFSNDFPPTEGAYNTSTDADTQDVYVSILAADGSTLLASSRFGGSDYEFSSGIALDLDGNPCIVGYTASNDYPTTVDAYDDTFGGVTDYFVTKLTADLSALNYSTYLGGNAADDDGTTQEGVSNRDAGDIELVGTDDIYLIGSTRSTDFPTTDDAWSKDLNGDSDVFVTYLGSESIPTTSTSISTTTSITEATTPISDDDASSFDIFTATLALVVISIIVMSLRYRKRGRE